MEFVFLVAACWSLMGVVGYFIAKSKGRDAKTGCLWGVFLGPIGWLVVALSSDQAPSKSRDGRALRKCTYCAELILDEALVCKFCGREIQSNQEQEATIRFIEKMEPSSIPKPTKSIVQRLPPKGGK